MKLMLLFVILFGLSAIKPAIQRPVFKRQIPSKLQVLQTQNTNLTMVSVANVTALVTSTGVEEESDKLCVGSKCANDGGGVSGRSERSRHEHPTKKSKKSRQSTTTRGPKRAGRSITKRQLANAPSNEDIQLLLSFENFQRLGAEFGQDDSKEEMTVLPSQPRRYRRRRELMAYPWLVNDGSKEPKASAKSEIAHHHHSHLTSESAATSSKLIPTSENQTSHSSDPGMREIKDDDANRK